MRQEPLPRGLPAPLPEGERLLWQGRPTVMGLARRAFHVDLVAAYFALLALWGTAAGTGPAGARLAGVAATLEIGAAALAILVGLAWLSARTTTYTLTDRRVLLQIGIALSLTVNLPLREIEGAALRRFGDGTGDVPLRLRAGTRLAYLHLWPHARPWRLSRPEPLLRSLPDAAVLATRLAAALAAAHGQAPQAVAAADAAPDLPGRLAAAHPV
ncbi:hypothetical protein OPKNFCMD_4377 [Methylobacterium crusticola]|uniref:YdbS-like PH domain-containing protein n=1 Tax=Methylobacterium crusticola TaxID=1697972 RepID=A0ABQ4R4G1_9HYPH|nr:photosynthetic complex putative assembly protein PuhB [Methylobacterium crusticola]GJD51622.1 hypothetical protein OPKNFCMD_4377 [Methylobacterium crusticola]